VVDAPIRAPDAAHTALVLRCQRGDRAAFALLYGDYARVVHGIVVATAGAADADDLTQDVFMAVFERLPELRDPAAFPAWLCAAARNAGRDALRRRRTRRAASMVDEPVDELADRAGSPAAAAELRDAAACALELIRTLPEAYRETLVLRLVEGLSGPEIAARTGLTHGSVRVNLTRGMALLRPLLQQAGLP
jgi:RNA polymerase sigma-70 factor (ECF subfamily)